MILQKMKYKSDNERAKTVVCGVNIYACGGEYTICGNAIPDTNLKDFGCEAVGNEYKGRAENIPCHNCKEIIGYIKRD